MASEDSDDEPLSVLAAAKKANPEEFEDQDSDSDYGEPKRKKKKDAPLKKLGVTIKINRKLNTVIPVPVPVIARPTDVWLYLKDLNPTGPYSCLLCSDWFINRSKMIMHYALNHKKDYCGICRYFVIDRESWWAHEKFHTPWPCSQCVETFPTEIAVRTHLTSAHNLVHCRLCHFRVVAGDDYNSHLFQKHSVTNVSSKNLELLWEFEYEGSDKFQCLLCSKLDNLATTFFAHYMGFHHFTLKCLANVISGKDTPFLVNGAEVSDRFINEQLRGHVRLGYVDLLPRNVQLVPDPIGEATVGAQLLESQDTTNIATEFPLHEVKDSNITVTEVLLPDVKDSTNIITEVTDAIQNSTNILLEIKQEVSDTEDQKDRDNDVSEKDDNSQNDKTIDYRGEEDFDITQTELIVLEKCYFDYVHQTLTDINSNIVPQVSYIDYKEKNESVLEIQCSLCKTKSETPSCFTTHMSKLHSIKTVSIYSCRVCATTFDTYNELVNHTTEELGDFEDLWICQFCDKEFDGREATRKHLTEHWGSLDYENCFSPHLGFKCKYCPTLFWNETDRETHQIKVHFDKYKDQFYKCQSCSATFGDKVWFIHHYIKNHVSLDGPMQPYLLKCCQCCIVLPGVDEMRKHFEENHPELRKLYCTLDSCLYKPLSHRKSFKLHVKLMHGPEAKLEKPVKCYICQRMFASAKACGSHMSQIHGPGKFKCKLCGELLMTIDERKLHYLLRHPGQHPFECSVCGKSFQYKSSLYMHKQDHLPNKQSYTCTYCGKIFAKKDSYREHLQIHEGPRHACSYCPMRFVQRSNMLRHERRHTGERPYRCQHCPRAFADKGACTAHTRTHSRDTSYACIYCGQTFVQKSKLTYHIRRHTGENLESCTVCSKLFTSACSLREHMKTHLEKRKIVKCPLCDKGYHDERYMLRHLRTSHTRSQFSCPLCHKLLTSAAGLRHHVITHSRLNTFRCKCCPKSYAVKRSILKHLRKRHGLKDSAVNIEEHFTRLEPRECQLDLDEETMNSIFGPPKKKSSDLLLGDFVTFSKKLTYAQNALESNVTDSSSDESENNEERESEEKESEKDRESDEKIEITVKQEVQSGEEDLEPTDFVSVKIEPINEDSADCNY